MASIASTLRWHRAVAVGVAIVFVLIAIWSALANLVHPTGMDFLSFWAAGRLVLGGHPSAAYDIAAHGAVENTIAHIGGRMPFPYPPPFLAIVTPFALLPYGVAFCVWVAASAAFFAWACRGIAPLPFAFANAPACIDFMIGQNGFLISGILIVGTSLICSAPLLAGAVLGLMILKPQLALLLPVAMLAGREWRVILGALLSSSAVLLLGLILFGARAYEGFWDILPHYVALMRDSRLPWNELASPFALARFAGLSASSALFVHATIAAAAALLTARAWWLGLAQRVPILLAATMLIPPYFFTYDALLIVVPIGWLLRHDRPYVLAFVGLCCFVPVMTYFSPWVAPNLISLGAIASLCALHVPDRASVAGSLQFSKDRPAVLG